MASEISLSGLTLAAAEATEMNQAVFEKAWSKPELTAVHDVMTGIQMDTRIPIFGKIGLVGKASSSCTPNAGGVITTSEKLWTPKLFDFRLTHCEGDIDQLFKLWKRNRIALKTWEEVDNAQMAFIADRAMEAAHDAILRISDFGDTAAEVNLSGGVLTTGTDKTYFNTLSGLWKQVFTGVTATTIADYYEITENSAATKVAQAALGSSVALDVFRNLYDNADARIFDFPNLTFQVTRSLLNNWQALLEDKSLVFTLDRTEQGASKYSYRGIPIVVRNDWDRIIRTYEDNATTWNKPHRAILAPLSNIPVGTSDVESFKNFDSFYDKVTKSHYIDMAWYEDMKILEEYAIGAAY